MENLELLNPLEYYDNYAKQAFHDKADAYFEDLVRKSQLDIEKNRFTVSKYNQAKANLTSFLGKSGRAKLTKALLIIGSIVAVIVAIILLTVGFGAEEKDPLLIVFGFLTLLLCPLFIILIVLVVQKRITSYQKQVDDFTAQSNNFLTEAYGQMDRLNKSYDYGIFPDLMEETIPLFDMDKTFDPMKYQYLHEKYGFEEEKSHDISSVYTQSGAILGNPFVLQRNYVVKMVNHTYEGSKVIHWTTYVKTDKGVRAIHHTETLRAYVTKPEPYYYLDTWLVYGNEAADRLSFSRVPNPHSKLNDRALKKHALGFESTLNKKVEEAMKQGKQFTALTNREFEYLFNALDRDNDVQFRLLFTPIAQKSMMKLLRSNEPYGDDFVFLKRKNLNYIKSSHSQTATYVEDFSRYYSYSYDLAKEAFIKDANDYFRGLYFDLAPLMCIPLYQQHMSREYIYNDSYYANVTSYDTEAIANRYEPSFFAPKDATTNSILKCEFQRKRGKSDKVNIHAYAYRGENRTTVVSKLGGDGKHHDIVVHWIEYIPVEKVTPFVVQPISSEERFDKIIDTLTSDDNLITNLLTGGIYYRRGILSMLLRDDDNYDPDYIDKLLS